jgi:hypothetical protein
MFKINNPSHICLFFLVISLSIIIGYILIIHEPIKKYINYESAGINVIKNGYKITGKKLKYILEENLWVWNAFIVKDIQLI